MNKKKFIDTFSHLIPTYSALSYEQKEKIYYTVEQCFYQSYEFHENRRCVFTRLLNRLGFYDITSETEWYDCECCGHNEYVEYTVEIPNSYFYIEIQYDSHFGGKEMIVKNKMDDKIYDVITTSDQNTFE